MEVTAGTISDTEAVAGGGVEANCCSITEIGVVNIVETSGKGGVETVDELGAPVIPVTGSPVSENDLIGENRGRLAGS